MKSIIHIWFISDIKWNIIKTTLNNYIVDFTFRTNSNHKYPDTGGWAKYNAQFKDERKRRSISETSREANLLHTLLTMVNVAELLDGKLEDLNEFTIFTPNLASFEKLSKQELLEILTDKDALESIILKHIVPSTIKYEELQNGSPNELTTINGEKVTMQKNQDDIMVSSNFGNATLVSTNTIGENGVVQVVDNVI